MKDHIISHRQDPVQLEKLYRSNKGSFKKEFNALYPELKGSIFAEFWNERLNYHSEELNRGSAGEIFFVLIASLVAGIIAKFPAFFGIEEEFFYPRNIGFIVFPFLAAYFARKHKLSAKKIGIILISVLFGAVCINWLPDVRVIDALVRCWIHL